MPEVSSRPRPASKVKFITVCNEAFVPGLTVLLWSLRRHFTGFTETPFEVIHHPEMAPLAERTRGILADEFPNVRFVEADDTPYSQARTVNAEADNSAYFTLESFRRSDHDRVIFIDADMVVLQDFSDVLEIDHPFIACETRAVPKPYRGPTIRRGMVNTGFFVLGRQYLDGQAFAELSASVASNTSDTIRDQAIINAHIPIERIHVLPDTYNFQAFQHLGHFVELGPDIRILHFSGYWFRPKPWEDGAPIDSLAYRIWAEAAVAAIEQSPALRPLIPRFEDMNLRLADVQEKCRTGLGVLDLLRTDVHEDVVSEHHRFGDTTLNRARGLVPSWAVRFARSVIGGKPGKAV